jgi:hypothetical protein
MLESTKESGGKMRPGKTKRGVDTDEAFGRSRTRHA